MGTGYPVLAQILGSSSAQPLLGRQEFYSSSFIGDKNLETSIVAQSFSRDWSVLLSFIILRCISNEGFVAEQCRINVIRG